MRSSSSWSRISSSVAAVVPRGRRRWRRSRRARRRRGSSPRRGSICPPKSIRAIRPSWALVDGVPRLFVISSWGGMPVRASGASLESLQADRPVGVRVASRDTASGWRRSFPTTPAPGTATTITSGRRICAAGPTGSCRASARCDRPTTARPGKTSASSSTRRRDPKPAIRRIASCSAASATSRPHSMPTARTSISTSASTCATGDRRASRSRGSRGPIVMRRSARRRSGTMARGSRRPRTRRSTSAGSIRRARRWSGASGRFTIARARNDVFWGPSIHWNTYLEQYVMLLNRAKDDQFGQEGIYVSFSPTLQPQDWSAPAKIMNGGGWYPQVIGGEAGSRHRSAGGQACALLHDRAIGTDHRVRTLTRAV